MIPPAIKNGLTKLVEKIAASDAKKERPIWLIGAGALGLFIAIIIMLFLSIFSYTSRITGWFAVISIPVLFVLWIFRTHDTREQIAKAEENTTMSTYSKGIDLIFSPDSVASRAIGLLLLSHLKAQKSFAVKIDAITSQGLDLKNAYLPAANLVTANLRKINLSSADLSGSNLTKASLVSATLTEASMTKATLAEADMTKTNLAGANLREASLIKTDMRLANLTGAYLIKANLTEANLTRANLTETDLRRANFTRAYLSGANLTRINLTGANLTRASLRNACLTEADLRGADLTEANLTGVKFKNTVYSDSTQGLNPEDYAGLLIKGQDDYEQ